MKKYLFLLLLVLIGFSGVAQDNDVYKKLINASLLTILKAQKHMVASNKTDQNGLLAKAAILQGFAVKQYKAKNNEKAACLSALARNYSAEIIKNITGNVNETYLIHADEKTLVTNCASETDLYNESIKNMKGSSVLDKDYIKIEDLNTLINF